MTMTLYNARLSPFAARCRIAIYAKGLDVEMIDVPAGAPPAELGRLNPMNKVPTFVHDGFGVPESEVICEYLEDLGLGPSLRPETPEACSRARLLARIGDLYVMGAMEPLFGQIDPRSRDRMLAERHLADLLKAMGWLGHYLDGSPYAVGGSLSIADCALAPILFFFEQIGPLFGFPDPMKDMPSVAAYYRGVKAEPAVARVLAELDQELRRTLGGR